MLFVGAFPAVMAGKEHHKVGDEIGERVYAVRDKAMRARKNAGKHLTEGQGQINGDAHPCAA